MVDPVLNFFNALFLIFESLPGPYFSLFLLNGIFAGIIVFIRIVGKL